MGKKKRKNKGGAGQKDSDSNNERSVDFMKVQGKKANQIKKKNRVAGPAIEKPQSGGKKAHSWTSAQELIVLKELAKLAKMDRSKPLDNSRINFEQLAIVVGERLELSFTRTQIYEKARRLKERYARIQENISGKLASFKNKDDEEMFKLSQKVWGANGALELQPNVKDNDLPSSDSGTVRSEIKKGELQGSSRDDFEVKRMEVEQLSEDSKRASMGHNERVQEKDDAIIQKMEVEQLSEDSKRASTGHNEPVQEKDDAITTFDEQRHGFNEEAKLDRNHTGEGDIKKIFEAFQTGQQALLKDVEKHVMTVLEEMEAKFLTPVSRGRSTGLGFGTHISSIDLMLQDAVSWDKITDRCLINSKGDNSQAAAFESLVQQWHQQRLQELNLTSLKLQLMLDGCQREKERMEKL